VVTIENQHVRVVFKQIAGLIARRIVFWKQLGASVAGGEKVGLIKFGSRVDLIVPRSVTLAVKLGDHVAGGLTVIGRISR
jgi:phosphatidylserine decarboxylase